MNSSSTILFVGTNDVEKNATQQKLYFLASGLEKLGTSVDVAVPNHLNNVNLLRELDFKGVVLSFSDKTWLEHLLKREFLLRNKTYRFVYTIGAGLRSLVPRRRGRAVICDLDEWLPYVDSLTLSRRIYLNLVYQIICRHAFGLTYASDLILRNALKINPSLVAHSLYLPVAVSEDDIHIDDSIVKSEREKYRGKKTLVYVGAISRAYEAQIEELFDLATRLSAAAPELFIKILGAGDRLSYWRERATESRNPLPIEFAGPVRRSKIASYLESAAALLFPFPPTRQNLARCPTKAYHYAAARRPVVTNPTGEVARLFGSNAFYYKSGDPASFLRNVISAVTTDQRSLAPVDLKRLLWQDRAERLNSWLEAKALAR